MTNPPGQNSVATPPPSTTPASELDILYTAIAKLADAQSSDDVLNAVVDYPRSSGAVAGTLGYIHSNADGLPESWEVAAEWGDTSAYQRGQRGSAAQALPTELMSSVPRQPVLITDATVSDLLDPSTRKRCQKAHIYGLAFLPLHFRNQWTGFIYLTWNKPHTFLEQDQRLYTAFAHQLSIGARNAYVYRQVQAAERSIQEQANFLQNLIDRIPNPIFYKDAQGLYQGCNTAFEELYGKPRSEVVGKSVYDLNPSRFADLYYAKDQEVFQNPDQIQIYESPVRYADGTTHTVIYTKASLKNSDGSLYGLVGVATDITERRGAEDALRENETRLSLIMDNSQEAILLMDMDANILMANPAACRMFGYSEAEILTHKLIDLIDAPDIRARHFIKEAIQTGHASGELTAFHKEYAPFPVEVSVGLFMSRDGQQQLGSVTIHDLTNRNRLQQALIEEEKLRTALTKETELSFLKTRMMDHIAHAFRTPLTVIQASAESLDAYSDRLDDEQRKIRLQNIYIQVQNLSRFLTQIGLVMNGRLVPENVYFSTVDLSILCKQIVRELESKYSQPAKFILSLPESCMIRADLTALKNALSHVMQNALQFSQPNSPVKIRLSEFEEDVEMTIVDTGIGIPFVEQERIFEAFFRAGNIGNISGLGLGLTIAKACIELHHGTITVESVPTKGTTVYIRLPKTQP